jgi:hypothetical protein
MAVDVRVRGERRDRRGKEVEKKVNSEAAVSTALRCPLQ